MSSNSSSSAATTTVAEAEAAHWSTQLQSLETIEAKKLAQLESARQRRAQLTVSKATRSSPKPTTTAASGRLDEGTHLAYEAEMEAAARLRGWQQRRAQTSKPAVASTCIDLGFALSEMSISWPTCAALTRQVIKSPESTQGSQGARSKQSVGFNCGSGTHIDAPSHFIADGRTVEQLTTAELAHVALSVVDVVAACNTDSTYKLTAQDICRDEERHGAIPPRSLVCIRTGWAEKRYTSKEQYYNQPCPKELDESLGIPSMQFPGVSVEAAAALVEREVVGVGIDTLSPDGGDCGGGAFGAHHTILGADRYILENLLLTSELPPRGAIAVVAPLNLAGAPESPTRVWAFVPST